MSSQNPVKGAGGCLGTVLARLPVLVDRTLADLETLLARDDVTMGKEVLAQLVESITLHPVGGGLEAEMRGNLRGLLKLQPPARPGAD